MKNKKRKILVLCIVVLFVSVYSFFCFWRYQDRDYKITFQYDKQEDTMVPDSINIGTYNIKSLNNGEGLKDFTNDVKGLNLDVIALQEVDKNASRSNNMDIVKELAGANSYEYYYFYESMWILDGSYGLGVLSKYPIVEVTSNELPNGTLSEPIILAGATIDVNGELLHIYNTHLNYFNKELREEQVEFIRNKVENKDNTILMGDMNNFEVEDFYTIDGFRALNTEETTYMTFRDFGFTDNIYLSNDLDVSDVSVKTTTFSDHNLFWCVVHLNGK